MVGRSTRGAVAGAGFAWTASSDDGKGDTNPPWALFLFFVFCLPPAFVAAASGSGGAAVAGPGPGWWGGLAVDILACRAHVQI